MSDDNLEKSLESLHSSLGDSPLIDAEMANKLRLLIDEINAAIANSTPAGELPPSESTLTSRVQSFVDDFEMQHPKLTANLSLIAERLADMGI